MDERRSLALLGWTVGGTVGLMFALNAIALSLAQGGAPPARLLVSHVAHPVDTPVDARMNLAPAAKANRI